MKENDVVAPQSLVQPVDSVELLETLHQLPHKAHTHGQTGRRTAFVDDEVPQGQGTGVRVQTGRYFEYQTVTNSPFFSATASIPMLHAGFTDSLSMLQL